jgi:hypothetical protein
LVAAVSGVVRVWQAHEMMKLQRKMHKKRAKKK